MSLPKEVQERIHRECAEKIKLDSSLLVITTTQEAQKWAQAGYISGATAEAERSMKLVEILAKIRDYLPSKDGLGREITEALSEYNNTETKTP